MSLSAMYHLVVALAARDETKTALLSQVVGLLFLLLALAYHVKQKSNRRCLQLSEESLPVNPPSTPGTSTGSTEYRDILLSMLNDPSTQRIKLKTRSTSANNVSYQYVKLPRPFRGFSICTCSLQHSVCFISYGQAISSPPLNVQLSYRHPITNYPCPVIPISIIPNSSISMMEFLMPQSSPSMLDSSGNPTPKEISPELFSSAKGFLSTGFDESPEPVFSLSKNKDQDTHFRIILDHCFEHGSTANLWRVILRARMRLTPARNTWPRLLEGTILLQSQEKSSGTRLCSLATLHYFLWCLRSTGHTSALNLATM